jgi:hypothetical protein
MSKRKKTSLNGAYVNMMRLQLKEKDDKQNELTAQLNKETKIMQELESVKFTEPLITAIKTLRVSMHSLGLEVLLSPASN